MKILKAAIRKICHEIEHSLQQIIFITRLVSEINTSRSSKVSLTSLFRGLRAFLIDETSLIENDFSCSTTHNDVKSNYEGASIIW